MPAELMACPDIDGTLVGGASPEPQSFLDIFVRGAPESSGWRAARSVA